MEQILTELKTPKTCKECFTSPFKKPRPECWYEKAHHLQKLDEFFKNELDMDLAIDINSALMQLKPLCIQCLKTLDTRVREIQQEHNQKQLKIAIDHLAEELTELKNNKNDKGEMEKTPIYKQERDMEAPIRVVNKMKVPDIKIKTVEKKPHGGWKVFQRNVKPENLKEFLLALKERKKELSDEIDKAIDQKQTSCIDITHNKKGNLIIKYRDVE